LLPTIQPTLEEAVSHVRKTAAWRLPLIDGGKTGTPYSTMKV